MSKLEFTTEDFLHEKFRSLSPLAQEALRATAEFSAVRANARLAEMLAQAPTITVSGKELSVRFDALPEKFRARLVNVEKLDE